MKQCADCNNGQCADGRSPVCLEKNRQAQVRAKTKRYVKQCLVCGEDRLVAHGGPLTRCNECYVARRAKQKAERRKSLVGSKFGKWTVLVPIDGRVSKFRCGCDCGRKEAVLNEADLKNGERTQCVLCYKEEIARRLPERIALFHGIELTLAEIAQVLGCSVEAVQRRISGGVPLERPRSLARTSSL